VRKRVENFLNVPAKTVRRKEIARKANWTENRFLGENIYLWELAMSYKVYQNFCKAD